MRAILLFIFTTWLGLGVPTRAFAERESISVEEQYELGMRFLRRGYYVRAMEQFNRIRNYHRDDPYAVRAELAIADLYYDKGEWDQARLAYMDFQRSHPRHEQLDYVVYRIGMCFYRKAPRIAARDQAWTRQAVNQWVGFQARFPDSEYGEEVAEKFFECQERLARKELLIARFYERREAWVAVSGRAEGLLNGWPESSHVPEALELLSIAYAWQGNTVGAQEAYTRLADLDEQEAEALDVRLREIYATLEEPD